MARSTSPSASRRSSSRWNRCVTVLAAVVCALALNAQNRAGLEKKRDALDKQIKQTSALIDQAHSQQKNTAQQVQLLEAQIRQRQELINTMNSEVVRVDQEIQDTRGTVRDLESELAELKEEYARMIQFAYMNRSSYDRLSYIFAAESFNQAFKRSRYLEQLAQQRQQQAGLIAAKQDSLNSKATVLEARKRDKTNLLDRQLTEAQKLTTDKKGQQQALDGLKKEEGRLKAELNKQEKQRKELASAIRKSIEAEIAKSTKPASGSSTAKAGGALKLELTPEAKVLSTDFENNKGKLPWPVDKGTITSSFGKQPHPVLKGITIENNGLDIGCVPGAAIRAVFRGEVSSVIVIPGAGKAVVLNHGAYRTVYSNLRDVSVSKGQQVDTKQQVGTAMTEDGASTAHIEVWRITSDGQLQKVDPAAWITQ
jgi:septal ring factor EnvC (AmiA/AmiB activator)